MTLRPGQALRVRPLGLPLAQLAGVAVILFCVEAALLAAATASPGWILFLFPVAGMVYVATGLVAWGRRPLNRMGPLITAGGFGWFAVSLNNVQVPTLVWVGEVLATLPLAIVVHLLLAFPSGRLTTWPARVLTVAGYVVCLVLQAPLYLFRLPEPPDTVLGLVDRPDLAATGHTVQTVCGLVVMVGTSIVLGQRLRQATPAQRRVLVPLDAYGILAVLFVPLSATISRALDISPLTVFVVQLVALAGVPAAFALSVLRGGFARTVDVEELAAWLGAEAGGRPTIEETLAVALGDSSLEVRYAKEAGDIGGAIGGAIGGEGSGDHAVATAPGSTNRAVVDIDLAGRVVAWVHYDSSILPDPDHVTAAGRVVALALDRERLTAELLQRTRELEESRTRILEAEDRERRRIAHDLHDGLQAQLVLMSLKAARLAEAVGAPEVVRRDAGHLRFDLDAAASELRRLVHGLVPALLIERGLFAAAEDLADLMPFQTDIDLRGNDRGMPGAVETTAYFVVAEALTNAVKHSGARHASVALHRAERRLDVEVSDNGAGGATLGIGSGLRGIADRLDVLGGTLRIESAPGRGTRIVGSVPCEP